MFWVPFLSRSFSISIPFGLVFNSKMYEYSLNYLLHTCIHDGIELKPFCEFLYFSFRFSDGFHVKIRIKKTKRIRKRLDFKGKQRTTCLSSLSVNLRQYLGPLSRVKEGKVRIICLNSYLDARNVDFLKCDPSIISIIIKSIKKVHTQKNGLSLNILCTSFYTIFNEFLPPVLQGR